jgi:hypothetical protein
MQSGLLRYPLDWVVDDTGTTFSERAVHCPRILQCTRYICVFNIAPGVPMVCPGVSKLEVSKRCRTPTVGVTCHAVPNALFDILS